MYTAFRSVQPFCMVGWLVVLVASYRRQGGTSQGCGGNVQCVVRVCTLTAPPAGGDGGAGAVEGGQPGDNEGGQDVPAGRAFAVVDQTQVGLSRLVDHHQRLTAPISPATAPTTHTQSVLRPTADPRNPSPV